MPDSWSLYIKYIIWPTSREKWPRDITNSVDKVQPNMICKTAIRNPIGYTKRNICAIDVTSVKKCWLWLDAASETRWLVWVYILHISEGPFSLDTGNIYWSTYSILDTDVNYWSLLNWCMRIQLWIKAENSLFGEKNICPRRVSAEDIYSFTE